MTVLLLAGERDLTADRMVRELAARSVEVLRFDTAWFPSDVGLDAEFRDGSWRGALRVRQRNVDLQRLRSVWYRSPSAFDFPADLNPVERQWAGNEAKVGLGGVLTSLPMAWVNHPARQADAAVKPVQLWVAARCGFTVPDTLLTNEPRSVRRFADDRATVTKALSAPAVVESGRRATAFTHVLAEADLRDLRGVAVTVHQFQRWVSKAYEVRLIVVGERMFAAGIHAGTDMTRVDWRNGYDDLAYSRPVVPDPVRRAALAYLEYFDCAYGAFDLVVDPDGEWVFLECNPGGQYGWIEDATGYGITAAIADLLTSRPVR